MNEKENKLIKKIKNGNQKAFKNLYELYADYALRTAFAITRNNSDASDIVQETFIKVYRHIDSFDETRSFRPWFYQLLINESRRYMKKNAKNTVPIESEQILDHLHYINQEDLDYDDLEIALDKLDDIHRTVLILKYLNGFTEKEIANLMEVNVNTIKSRLFKGRQKLKAAMGGMDNE